MGLREGSQQATEVARRARQQLEKKGNDRKQNSPFL